MLQINDRVKNLASLDSGIGKVLDIAGDKAKIFFINHGLKTYNISFPELQKVEGSEAENELLDRLTSGFAAKIINYKSIGLSVKEFLHQFPLGFKDPKYIVEERNYKFSAHELVLESLNEKQYTRLLKSSDYPEIIYRAKQIMNKTNLIFPNEKMALYDALKNESNQRYYSEELYFLLHGDSDLSIRFEKFAECLRRLEAAKWTTMTYFLFLAEPQEYMFMKPTIVQNAAELSAFDINYGSKLNWATYKNVLEFSHYLKKTLTTMGLTPIDMIDVQSFMYRIAPE